MRLRFILFAAFHLACTADDGDAADTKTDESSSSSGGAPSVDVSGDAFAFGPYTMIAGATVTIRELPEQQTATDADGHFAFTGLPAGAATFVFAADGYPLTSTKTFMLEGTDAPVERVTFQVPDDATYDLLATVVDVMPDASTCQIASTVTRVGKSIYDEGAHGEAAATVTIDPPLPAEHGPIYFNAQVIPQRDLTETSEDGGVLFVNVPAGQYTLTASKPGVEFEAVDIACEGGVLVNASPPYGLQAL
ncbi:MAG TPA: carboxypeptidase-like regulatory domain-containing protein [Nannocystaceae bacterium]|nr:carboxypeptidase-like regulatory domain-containing protein [Nannocystaceae bacterium]